MTLRLLLVHLRFHFQLLLAPVWLWGWLLAGGGLHITVVLGFVAFHLFLYTGVTAFNSYYDRDVGPVGGLEQPPPVPEVLLPFSLLLQAIGFGLCLLINATVAVLYGVFVTLSIAYSHPRIRVKAHPFGSLALVAFGQGMLVFAAVWAAVRGSLVGLNTFDGVVGSLAAALLILAQYPLTQLYQVEEDAARGDRTLAVVRGQRVACWFAIGCTCLGGACMLVVLLLRFGVVDAVLVGAGLVIQIALMQALAHALSTADTLTLFRRTTKLSQFSATALASYLVVRLLLSAV